MDAISVLEVGRVVGQEQAALVQVEAQGLGVGRDVPLEPADEFGQLRKQRVDHRIEHALAIAQEPKQRLRGFVGLLDPALTIRTRVSHHHADASHPHDRRTLRGKLLFKNWSVALSYIWWQQQNMKTSVNLSSGC